MTTSTLISNMMSQQQVGGGVPVADLVDAATALTKFVSQVHTLSPPKTVPEGTQGLGRQRQCTQIVSDSDEGASTKEETSIQGKPDFFPRRLMAVLADDTLSDIICWLPNGRSFAIMKPDAFVDRALPKYFPDSRGGTKYQSFTRKLNRWGFRQLTNGSEAGAFCNPLFRREAPELCLNMVCRSRKGSKTQKPNWVVHEGEILPAQPETKPNKSSGPGTIPFQTVPVLVQNENPLQHSGNYSVANMKQMGTYTSSSEENYCSRTAALKNQERVIKTLSQDKKLLAIAHKKREEAERMRIAQAMLYTAFLNAL